MAKKADERRARRKARRDEKFERNERRKDNKNRRKLERRGQRQEYRLSRQDRRFSAKEFGIDRRNSRMEKNTETRQEGKTARVSERMDYKEAAVEAGFNPDAWKDKLAGMGEKAVEAVGNYFGGGRNANIDPLLTEPLPVSRNNTAIIAGIVAGVVVLFGTVLMIFKGKKRKK